MARPIQPEKLSRLVQTRVTPSVGDELKRRAKADGRSEADYVRQVILRHLAKPINPEGSR